MDRKVSTLVKNDGKIITLRGSENEAEEGKVIKTQIKPFKMSRPSFQYGLKHKIQLKTTNPLNLKNKAQVFMPETSF